MHNLDCLLIHVPKMDSRYKPIGENIYIKYMPVGLLAIADTLNKNGFAVEVFHKGVEFIADRGDDLVAYLKATKASVAAFSLHWHPQSYDTIQEVLRVHEELPNVKIILGGITASVFANEIMEYTNAIFGIIKGDGEYPMLCLMRELTNSSPIFSAVPNLIWKNDTSIVDNKISYVATKENLDELVYTNFKLLKNHREYIDTFGRSPSNYMKIASKKFNTVRRSRPTFIVPVARGCNSNCKWCGGSVHAHRLFSERRAYTFRSIPVIINEIKKAIEYGYGIIHFAYYTHKKDDLYFIDLFEAIKKEHLAIGCYFECSTLPTKNLIDAFEKSFKNEPDSAMCISRLAPNETTRRIHTGSFYSNEELMETLDYLDKKKINVELTFTLGFPGETEDDIVPLKQFKKSILKRFKCIKGSIVLTNQMEPGSYWTLNPEQFGIETTLKTFSDFVDFHSKSNSFYTHLGYMIPDYFKKEKIKTEEEFRIKIQKIRCDNFCLLSGKYFGLSPNFIGKAKCYLMQKYWAFRSFRKKTTPNDYTLCPKKITQSQKIVITSAVQEFQKNESIHTSP